MNGAEKDVRSRGDENESEWKNRKEIQSVNAREAQQIMAENCQAKCYYSFLLFSGSEGNEQTGNLQNT